MRRISGWTALLPFVAVLAGPACRPETSQAAGSDSVKLAAREARLAQSLAHRDSGAAADRPAARWMLPMVLSEVSGLSLTPDQRLLAHGDERAAVTEIDYRRGRVVKQFLLGKKKTLHGDFEGIAVAGDRMFLLASNGDLYEFKEGKAGERVDYTRHETHLGKECEFEGVAFDPATASLLLACKRAALKEYRNFLVIYRWKLERGDGPRLSVLTVPLEQAIGSNGWKTIQPSDITVDPITGNYVLIASQQRALIEISPAGEVLLSRRLPGTHDMAEGVAITRDSILIVSDEAVRGPAAITLYRWP